MRMRKEKKKKIGKWMVAAASRWKEQIQNEWMNISLTPFFFLISTTFSLSLFSMAKLWFFVFVGGMRVDLNMRTETPHNPKRNG
jgi:hypothetical protein